MSLALRRVVFDAALFAAMLAEAEAGEGTFLFRLRDEWTGGVLRFERPGEVLLGAFDGDRLVAVGGVSLDPYSAEPGLGRVRHVYVLRERRGEGIGCALVAALIERSRGRFAALRLRTRNPAAAALYERLGFARDERDGETHRIALG